MSIWKPWEGRGSRGGDKFHHVGADVDFDMYTYVVKTAKANNISKAEVIRRCIHNTMRTDNFEQFKEG